MNLNDFLEKGFSEMRKDIRRNYHEDYFMTDYVFRFKELDPNISRDTAIKMIRARCKTELETNDVYLGDCCCHHMEWSFAVHDDCVHINGQRLSPFDD